MVTELASHVDLDGRNVTTDRLCTSYQLTTCLMERSMTTRNTYVEKKAFQRILKYYRMKCPILREK